MADILDELLGGNVSQGDLAAALRRQVEYGTAGALSGSKRLAPVGAGLREEALGQAADVRQRSDAAAAGKAKNALEALKAKMAAAEKAADRAQRAADNAANRALQRDLASMREAGADKRAAMKAKGKAPVAVTPEQLEEQAVGFDEMANYASDMIKRTGPFSAGLASLGKIIPGLPPHNLDADLQFLRSNMAFTKLAELKAASKTGASGLGQVTEKEIDLLMASIANLETSQGPEQLRKNLATVQRHYATLAAKLRAGRAEAASAAAEQEMGVEDEAAEEDDIDALMNRLLRENPELAQDLESF